MTDPTDLADDPNDPNGDLLGMHRRMLAALDRIASGDAPIEERDRVMTLLRWIRDGGSADALEASPFVTGERDEPVVPPRAISW